ncbi:hypothetical protein ACHAQH_003477 [Verticillium albo-atrum]
MNERGEIPPGCEFDHIRDAAIKACDPVDGLVDGIMADEANCQFDPMGLVGEQFNCSTTGKMTTLSETAALAAAAAWDGPSTPEGDLLWYGPSMDARLSGDAAGGAQTADLGYAQTLCQIGTCEGAPVGFGDVWIPLFVQKNSSASWTDLTRQNFASLFKAGVREFDSIIGNADADLSEYRAAGGKILTYHGTADGLIPLKQNIHYYNEVLKMDPNAQDFYRFFEVPGLAHCAGGNGGQPTQSWAALRALVEEGKAPDTLPIKLEKQEEGLKDRILCPYPQKARFVGTPGRNVTGGQGVQKVGMMTPWIEAFPATAKPIVEEIDHCLGYKLSDVIRDGPGKTLTKTSNAQPAIMATSILILRILEREFGFDTPARIDVTLGHSLGEFAALVAGGYIAFEDSLSLVRARARAMEDATRAAIDQHGGEYGMVAVITEPEYLDSLVAAVDRFVRPGGSMGSKAESNYDLPPFQQVSIANVNSKNQIVLSGDVARIKTLVTHLRQFLGHDARDVRLNSDSPFHSPIMRPAVATIRHLLAGKSKVRGREGEDIVTFPGRLPCVSNVSARPFENKAELQDLLARQCLETVRWWDSIKYLDQEEKVRRWIGIGPGRVGRNLVGKEVGMKGHDTVKGGGVWAITDPSDIEEVLRGLEETERITDEEINV